MSVTLTAQACTREYSILPIHAQSGAQQNLASANKALQNTMGITTTVHHSAPTGFQNCSIASWYALQERRVPSDGGTLQSRFISHPSAWDSRHL